MDPLGASWVAPHSEMSGAPTREPTEPKDERCWLPPPHAEGAAATAAAGHAPHGLRPSIAIPPRCGKEREAGEGEDVEEPARWRWAANGLLILTAIESPPSPKSCMGT